jgi:drug/metabolite transporter (DMT)-like permease
MTTANMLRLVALAAIWGASFIFFRIIAPVLGAIWTAEFRVLIAGIALLAYALISRSNLQIRKYGLWYAIIGVLNSGIPFALIAFAQLKLTASMAAILNATTPMWSLIIGVVAFQLPFTIWKALGLVLGILGVGVLVGWSPLEPGLQTTLSVIAMLTATLCYGIAINMTRAKLQNAPPLGSAVGSQFASSALLALFMPFDLPRAAPSSTVILCMLALALVCTAVAYLLYFRLIRDIGAVPASTVTLIIPIFSMIWGALFLGENITGTKILACAIILSGVGFINGFLPVVRRRLPA